MPLNTSRTHDSLDDALLHGAREVRRRPYNILIIEDNHLLLRVMQEWMKEEWDATVFSSRTFKRAQAILQHVVPDVLVTDVRLGPYNGIQLAMLARHSNPDVSIVVISGFDDAVLRREAGRFNAEFLLKPLTRKVLLGTVQSLRGNRSEPGTVGVDGREG